VNPVKLSRIFALTLLGVALTLLGCNLTYAAPTPSYYGGEGGTISGLVVSPSGGLVDWAQIHATNGNETFEAFSGFSGLYLMRVPAGEYNVSVYDPYSPQWWGQSANVTVADNSTTTLNFYLQAQPPSPVPEFLPYSLALIVVLALAVPCLLTRRSRPTQPQVTL
jgi:hypothetical protein